ncbi:hypothetical protein ASPZODRAFT_28222 [Penicilliopsis zonata CBS 506.65]|uniref:HNH nuclease domain-containing protein n=1 Tax=Penicilliopsis zonata CBS 506.65 TaxID=1073090 RepID=A0A1L9S8R7_9EURO|nr:hypothetical protein ASPZODRAFT_28222 [Penicilliopsis zonata CBS 506.65]OJJ43555.1 hypothetical protein ASPZODRAFT_28222 [Penicilliopsis zonata CBS 506.65]
MLPCTLKCRNVRGRLQVYSPESPSDDTANLLRQVFKYLPSDGRRHLADDILQCASDSQVRQLAESVVTGLLTPLKAAGLKTASVTPSPRIGLEDSIENLGGMVEEPMTRKQQELRDRCLPRDGNRCVVSGVFDWNNRDIPDGKPLGFLEAAHIVPFSLATFRDHVERDYIVSVWTNMFRYFPSLRSRLGFEYRNINDPRNVMMLEAGVHSHFGLFKLALEPTETPNQYQIKTFGPVMASTDLILPQSRLVTLVAHDGREELPSPILLQLHAAIASILHATGRGEAIEKTFRDYGNIEVLARSGSTDISRLLSVSSLQPAIVSSNVRPAQTETTTAEDEQQQMKHPVNE